MKKKVFIALFTIFVLTAVTGCGTDTPMSQFQETSLEADKELVAEQETATQEITKETEELNAEELFIDWLPEGVTPTKAETEPNELLKQTIIDYYAIPEEYLEQTKYYYNYVDLDSDGAEEILAVIIGSYTSGSSGSSALWCREEDGEMQIYQAFTSINTPIIVTENATNNQETGAKGLILYRSGGGAETELVQLICKDGSYTNVWEAEAVVDFETVKGTAIICNNLMEDMESGSYLTLAD